VSIIFRNNADALPLRVAGHPQYHLPVAPRHPGHPGRFAGAELVSAPLICLPFFEFNGREPAIPPGGDFGPGFCVPGSCHSGFRGKVFATPTDTLTIALRPR